MKSRISGILWGGLALSKETYFGARLTEAVVYARFGKVFYKNGVLLDKLIYAISLEFWKISQ
jgi:hypothetical protein